MYVTDNKLSGLGIVSLQTGATVGTVQRPLIDYRSLDIVALVCSGRSKAVRVVMTRDVRELAMTAVLINSDEDVIDAAEVVRLTPLLQDNFRLIGTMVKTELGTKLGRVESYTIETQNLRIQKLYIKPPLWKSLLMGSLVIDRSQIVDVSSKQITVRDATITEPLVATQSVLPE